MDVSVIYVNWNAAEEIAASIASIRTHARDINYEIIVVDNHSAESLRVLEQPDIRLIRNPANPGFGAGCNIGAAHARGRYLLFLNPDTRLNNDILSGLSRFLDETPAAGGCGPRILNEDGSIQFGAARSFITPVNEFLEHSTLAFHFPQSNLFGRPYYSFWDHQSTRPVEALLGACMMFRRELFEALKGFDATFFLYAEEVDLCKRAWDAGHEIHYVHDSEITHKSKHSTSHYFGGMTPMTLQYFVSVRYYIKKHYGVFTAAAWRAMLFILYFARFLNGRDRAYLTLSLWSLGIVRYHHPNL